jgi:glucose/arabinose dehydrogenase
MAPRLHLLFALVVLAACGRTPPPTPSPPTNPGETISGRERLGWDQQAGDAAELATFRYAIYVDGVRSELADVTCGTTSGPAGFACSGRLPALTNGAHTLELAAFILDASGTLESGRSAPLRVTVTGLTAPPVVAIPLTSGETIATADRVKLAAEQLAGDLEDVAAIALLSGERVIVAERSSIRMVAAGSRSSGDPVSVLRLAADERIAAVTADADFSRTGHIFVIHAMPGTFRLVRYRLAGDALVERTPLMRDVAASSDAAAALAFGPDRKLYAAFDDGGSRDAAARASEWNGKILRLNPDATTPDDQVAASPVIWSGLRAPRGLGWMPEDGTLWWTEARTDGVDRLAVLGTESIRPRRLAERASYQLPQPFGARMLAFHPGGEIPELRGNLLIAANDAGYLLRIRFERSLPQSAARIVTSERLLEGRIGPVRAVSVAPDGSIYVASGSALWRLSRSR